MTATANFNDIYRDNISLVRKIIGSFMISNGQADDLAQQTFLKVFEKLPTLRDTNLLKPWIASIARNSCLDSFRSQKMEKIVSNLSSDDLDPSTEFKLGLWFDPQSGEADIELEQNLTFVSRILVEYKKEPRGTVARLFYQEGLSTREISEHLQIPQSTILSHLLLFRREAKTALVKLQKRSH